MFIVSVGTRLINPRLLCDWESRVKWSQSEWRLRVKVLEAKKLELWASDPSVVSDLPRTYLTVPLW